MKFQIKTVLNFSTKTECLVVALKSIKKLSSQQSELNKLCNKSIDKMQKDGILTAKQNELVMQIPTSSIGAKRILYVGVGNTSKLDTESIRNILDSVAKKLKSENIDEATFDLTALASKSDQATVCRHLIESISHSRYKYQKKSTTKIIPFKANIYCHDKKQLSTAKNGASTGLAIANGKDIAKELGNMPGNICTPTYLASQAKKIGKKHQLKVTVLNESKMAELGMHSLLSVSKGSREPAKLIVLEYFGAKNKKEAPHALVGKGLTFDAGGISLKPAGKMDEMKYDMCGSASVLGAIHAVAEMKLPINVVAVIPSSENLPDGLANKPGDVVTSMSGTTIEILNTDAEGRLILCDALTYTKRFKPQSVIDIATLTGAVIVALGHQTAGVMGNDQGVVDDLLSAGETSLDFAWQLPLKPTYKKQLNSDYADLANIGGPSAGTITAGCFLSHFTEDFKWAHLDIAGTAWGGSEGKKATGRAVPILTQYLIDRSK